MRKANAVEAGRGRAVAAGLGGAIADDLGVDGAGDAVVELVVELGEDVLLVDGRVADVPHRRQLHDIAHHELLQHQLLGDACRKRYSAALVSGRLPVPQGERSSEARSIKFVTWRSTAYRQLRLGRSRPAISREGKRRGLGTLMDLSLGVQRPQLVQRTGRTWPRPFLERPWFRRFIVIAPGFRSLTSPQRIPAGKGNGK